MDLCDVNPHINKSDPKQGAQVKKQKTITSMRE